LNKSLALHPKIWMVLLCTTNVWTKVLLCTTNVQQKSCFAPIMVEQKSSFATKKFE
jgi:hypothetical protein